MPRFHSFHPARGTQGGFNSVEVLVGMSILAIAVAILGGYFRYNQKASKGSDASYIATQLAAARLERSKRQVSNPDTLKTLLAKIGAGEYIQTSKETLHGKDYQIVMRYRRISPAGNLMKVKATVSWDGVKRSTLGTAVPFTP